MKRRERRGIVGTRAGVDARVVLEQVDRERSGVSIGLVGEPGLVAASQDPREQEPESRRERRAAGVRLALLAALVTGCSRPPVRPTEATSVVYVRTDSDATTIVSPRVRVAAEVQEAVGLEASYGIDAWSGASIDVVTAATGTIRERRDEINAGARYTRDELTVSGGYRYSTEPDYWSHGATARAALDLRERTTTLALDAFGGLDEVGRAGDPWFRAPLRSAGARATWTQVLGPATLADLSWETTGLDGYQASAYRWVAIGDEATCARGALFCVREQVPDRRWRHALNLRGRHALGDSLSLGLESRLYVDSWGVRSLTAQPDVAWLLSRQGTASLRYRYYTQREADFYRRQYVDLDTTDGHVTRDRKLSPFYGQELGVSYVHEWQISTLGIVLVTGLRASVGRLRYLAFTGLHHVDVLETTGSVGVDFR